VQASSSLEFKTSHFGNVIVCGNLTDSVEVSKIMTCTFFPKQDLRLILVWHRLRH
jgi:hypothetical protein